MPVTRDAVRLSVEDGVAHVVLDRGGKSNSLDLAMVRGLVSVGEEVAARPDARVVVLSGAGKGFCAGLDFDAFRSMLEDCPPGERPIDRLGEIARTDGRPTHLAQQAAYVWRELSVPVIAAVHGFAVGAGLQLALMADLRIVAPDAVLGLYEVRWGMAPDMTGTWTLPGVVGLDVAKDLALTGRSVSGEEARSLGLATRLSDRPVEAALELAREMAGRNPDALRAIKELLNRAPGSGAAEQFGRERQVLERLLGTPNQREAVAAYFERRPPRFTDTV